MSYVVNKKSWHYKLNDLMSSSNFDWSRPKDFCSYWRRTIVSLFLFTIFFGAAAIIIGYMVFGLLFIVYMEPLVTLETLLCIIFLFSSAFGVAYLIEQHIKRNKIKEKKEPNTLIGMKYRSVKDKYCPMVEYKD